MTLTFMTLNQTKKKKIMLCNDILPIPVIRQRICNVAKRNKSFWADIPMGEDDEILSIKEAFEKCKSAKKFDLTMAIHRDKYGKPLVQKCVKKAEKLLSTMNLHKQYLPPLGIPVYRKLSAEVVLGKDCEKLKNDLNITSQGIARTGSLKLVMEFISHFYLAKKILYLSDPTWPNYRRMAENSQIPVGEYVYYNYRENKLNFGGMINSIKNLPRESIILFTACGHNPTGTDPTIKQWDEISSEVKKRDLLIIVDLNSQGIVTGSLDEDAYPLRKFIKDNHRVIAVQSFSKCMCLYGERIGACTFLADNKEEAERIESQLKIIIRTFYSNPPLHGSRVVVKILEDPGLQSEWQKELKEMAKELKDMRKSLVNNLYKIGSIRNWEHILRQKGSFGFAGLNRAQLKKLRDDYNLFLTRNGRLSLGSINRKNVDYIAYALHFVTK